MPIRIFNNSVSAVVRSFAVAQGDKANILVWLELAPQHPKVIGAIWASLVNGVVEELGLRDSDNDAQGSLRVEGLHSRYLRLTADAPRLAGRARPRFLRLVAPQATRIDNTKEDFYVFAWPGLRHGTALAAMLEAGTPTPILIDWGDYLLAEAERRGFATPLLTGGPAPAGFCLKGATPWAEIITHGIHWKAISLQNVTSTPHILSIPIPA